MAKGELSVPPEFMLASLDGERFANSVQYDSFLAVSFGRLSRRGLSGRSLL